MNKGYQQYSRWTHLPRGVDLARVLKLCFPIFALVMALAGCSLSTPDALPSEQGQTATPRVVRQISSAAAQFAYTYQQPDGNRVVQGAGAFPDRRTVDIPLDGTPQWVVAAPLEEGILWVVVSEDGEVQAFHVVGERAWTSPISETVS